MQLTVTRDHYEAARRHLDALRARLDTSLQIPYTYCGGICPLARAARDLFPGYDIVVSAEDLTLLNDGCPARTLHHLGADLVRRFDDARPWPVAVDTITIPLYAD